MWGRRLWKVGAIALALLAASCLGGSGADFPDPGWERGGTPGLPGVRVLLLPTQAGGDGVLELDREIAFALRSRGPGVDWRDISDLEGVPAAGRLGADPTALPVQIFGVGEVQRVGDPLYGDLYRLSAFIDAELIVLPLRGWWVAGEEGMGAVHLHAALVAPRTGRVLWQGIVRGRAGERGSPAPVASAAERLAARLLP